MRDYHTPPYRAIPFRDSIAEGGIAPICLVFTGYRASIAEIPLLRGGGGYHTSTSHAQGETLRKGGGGIPPSWPCWDTKNPIARNRGVSLRYSRGIAQYRPVSLLAQGTVAQTRTSWHANWTFDCLLPLWCLRMFYPGENTGLHVLITAIGTLPEHSPFAWKSRGGLTAAHDLPPYCACVSPWTENPNILK